MFCGPSATPWSPPPASGRTSPSAPSGSSDPRLQPRSLGSLDVMLSSGSCAPQTVEAKNVSKLSTHLDNCLYAFDFELLALSSLAISLSNSSWIKGFTSPTLHIWVVRSTSKTQNSDPTVAAVDHKKPANSGSNVTKKCQKNRLKEKTVNLDTGFGWFYL